MQAVKLLSGYKLLEVIIYNDENCQDAVIEALKLFVRID